jgi:hypothetical protein
MIRYADAIDETRSRKQHQPLDCSESTRTEALPSYSLIKEEIQDWLLAEAWLCRGEGEGAE